MAAVQKIHHLSTRGSSESSSLSDVSNEASGKDMHGCVAASGSCDAASMTSAVITTAPQEENNHMTNTKEKTPLCLLNELIRFNKVKHKYTLIDEQGPAHQKTFYIRLTLGDEQYSAQGQSIKKAQHQAALIALRDTKLAHPTPKNNDKNKNINNTITPTVMLNSLAMRCGAPVAYSQVEVTKLPGSSSIYAPKENLVRRQCTVQLTVGEYKFHGIGATRQESRHNAALKALNQLKNILVPVKKKSVTSEGNEGGDGEANAGEGGENTALKSEISVVHEIALKREQNIEFQMIRESGPPHMKTFVTRCTIGEFSVEGQGNGKKASKKDAAVKMIELLKQQEGELPVPVTCTKKPQRVRKNNRKQAIKIQRADPNYGVGINPISRLIQIQDAKKAPEPTYTLISEKGNPPHREFVMQIQLDNETCTGVGPNKKLAKRSAAEGMLELLGLNKQAPEPTKSSLKTNLQGLQDKKVTFIDESGTQNTLEVKPPNKYSQFVAQDDPGLAIPMDANTTAKIATELLQTGSSVTAERVKSQRMQHLSSASHPTQSKELHAEKQLAYLAQILGVTLVFNDFPKDSNGYLSLVTIGLEPSQVHHGAGPTKEEARDRAATLALSSLSKIGIDNVNNKAKRDGTAAVVTTHAV